MSHVDPIEQFAAYDSSPLTLPLTVAQYSDLVRLGHYDDAVGQVELLNGRIIKMNPQGPEHADPVDILTEWSILHAGEQFRIRTEKPIEIPDSNSSLEPDVAWVTRQSYARRHPQPKDIKLIIEASVSSASFDLGEKCDVYAGACIPEYWQVNILTCEVRVHRVPDGGVYKTIFTRGIDETIAPLCLPTATLEIATLFSGE